MTPLEFIIAFLVAAFAPSLCLLFYVWRREHFGHAPFRTIFLTFVYGAVVCSILALIIEMASSIIIRWMGFRFLDLEPAEITALIVAPLVEEGLKPMGVLRLRGHGVINGAKDGIVYGSASGLGFSAAENLLFEASALLSGGFTQWLLTSLWRAFSATFFHAGSTGLVGYGIGKKVEGRSSLFIVASFIGAVLAHSFYNLIIEEFTFVAILISVLLFAIVSKEVK
ncbi:MAG: PrsW family intramembrane metalloprotease [Candidatus Bathyarchaeia archaeon]